jgi:hypothetical protein
MYPNPNPADVVDLIWVVSGDTFTGDRRTDAHQAYRVLSSGFSIFHLARHSSPLIGVDNGLSPLSIATTNQDTKQR